MFAAAWGEREAVEALVAAGANVAAECRFNGVAGYTALHLAAKHNHGPLVRCLIAAGADVQAATSEGLMLLQVAERHASQRAVAVLRQAGRIKPTRGEPDECRLQCCWTTLLPLLHHPAAPPNSVRSCPSFLCRPYSCSAPSAALHQQCSS